MVGEIERVLVCATPFPERVIAVGLPGALSVTVSVAVRVPIAVGMKLTLTVQVLPDGPAGRVLGERGQLLLIGKSVVLPVGVMELMVTGDVPVLVNNTL